MTEPRPPSWRERLTTLGGLGLAVYLSTTVISMVVFSTLLHLGVAERIPWMAGSIGSGTLLGTAYVLTKVIQVPRIALTIAVTPLLARAIARFRRRPAPPPPIPAQDDLAAP